MLLFDPGLGTHLHGVPGATHWRGVAQIKIIQFINGHVRIQCSGNDIDAFGDFPVDVADHLRTQQAARLTVSSHTHVQLVGTGIVDLVIPAGQFDSERLKPCLLRFNIAQSRPGNDQDRKSVV